MTTEKLAHVKQNSNGEWKVHPLEEHLREVGRIAGKKAASFGSNDWAQLAGLWHDLGKYRPAFQSYLRRASGYDTEAHIEGKGKVDHSTAGALYAFDKLNNIGVVLAYLIAGHHAGLPDWFSVESAGATLSNRIDEGKKKHYLDEALKEQVPKHILNPILPTSKSVGGSEGLHLWIRMLFSCLVDADFLDTESFMSPEKSEFRDTDYSLKSFKIQFDHYIEQKQATATQSVVNQIRREILSDCRNAAQHEPGVFSLTVPTGGGKTLSGMAFALEHALKYDKKRIVIVIPYTSIIEQTAKQYRDIFGDGVIEHHSNLEPQQEDSASRLATENWDAPVIVTTNVQLLESLFAAKSSRCRKLHNLVNSVIIMDEAQLLPPEFLQPTLDILNMLVKYYGVSLVLSTATQPALASRKDSFGKTRLRGFDHIHEIIPNVPELNAKLTRVTISVPENLKSRSSWEDIAQQILQYDSVLAIVNTRKDSQALYALMPKDTLYLSGLMCGQHRSKVIGDIKQKFARGESVRVISTQLVEAGVDLDFPVVYRALTGLDSIIQASGRCNREGKLSKGKVFVFVPPNQSPKGMLRFAEQATINILSQCPENLIDPWLYSQYFEHYFSQTNLDAKGIVELLTKDASQGYVQFRSAAEKFKIIDDSATHNILIPYDQEAEKWIGILRSKNTEAQLTRQAKRRLQRYSVTVYESQFKKLRDIGAIEEITLGIWAICVTNAYDETKGLLSLEELYSGDPEAWMV